MISSIVQLLRIYLRAVDEPLTIMGVDFGGETKN